MYINVSYGNSSFEEEQLFILECDNGKINKNFIVL